jgi:hypothetical protein
MTPTDEEIFELLIREGLLTVHTTMPGEIVSYDPTQRRCTVQPHFKRVWEDGAAEPINPIENVPVVFPGGGGFKITWPLRKGDGVKIDFSERSLDIWLSKGGLVDPADDRLFDLTDAIVTPSLEDFVNTSGGASEDLTLEHEGGTKIRMTPAGKVAIENGAGAELLTQLSDGLAQLRKVCSTLSGSVTPTAAGPAPLSSAGQFVSMALEIAQIKALVDTLKE